jgi:hypothetical protein
MSYRRSDDPNDEIVSARMTLGQFLSGIALSFLIAFLVLGYASTR